MKTIEPKREGQDVLFERDSDMFPQLGLTVVSQAILGRRLHQMMTYVGPDIHLGYSVVTSKRDPSVSEQQRNSSWPKSNQQ
jgi:hypothetical protein